jgi:SAM-dependent methyltransferase
MDNETRIRRARTFDEIAELYAKGRGETDAQILDDLFSLSGIDAATARILEIGCGAGQATLPLARRGCGIVGIEMGANLAHIARARLAAFPQVSIVNTRFEDWQRDEYLVDMVLSVDAWHWLDPRTCYTKAADALKPHGILAIARTLHIYPPGFDSFFAEIQSSYEQIGVGTMPWPPPAPSQIPDLREELASSGCFNNIQITRRIREQQFTADRYIAFLATTSDHRLMAAAKRERLFAEMRRLIDLKPNGRIRRHTLTLLHVARKK